MEHDEDGNNDDDGSNDEDACGEATDAICNLEVEDRPLYSATFVNEIVNVDAQKSLLRARYQKVLKQHPDRRHELLELRCVGFAKHLFDFAATGSPGTRAQIYTQLACYGRRRGDGDV